MMKFAKLLLRLWLNSLDTYTLKTKNLWKFQLNVFGEKIVNMHSDWLYSFNLENILIISYHDWYQFYTK